MVGAHAEAPIAGYVTKVRGEVVAAAESGRLTLALGHALHQGYRLLTGADARLEARMKDGTVLTLGERTEFVIQQVTGAAVNSKSTRFELLKGAFRAVTTAPEASAKLDWQVRTPVAIIGVRGTEVWGGFNLLGAGDKTLDVVMLEGKGVFVETPTGMVDLLKAGDGTLCASTRCPIGRAVTVPVTAPRREHDLDWRRWECALRAESVTGEESGVVRSLCVVVQCWAASEP